MTTITLTKCMVAAVRADMVKGRVKITLEANLDHEMLAAKPYLAMFAVEELPVSCRIESAQPQLFEVTVQPLEVPAGEPDPSVCPKCGGISVLKTVNGYKCADCDWEMKQ